MSRYRTLCIAPPPDLRKVFDDLRDMKVATWWIPAIKGFVAIVERLSMSMLEKVYSSEDNMVSRAAWLRAWSRHQKPVEVILAALRFAGVDRAVRSKAMTDRGLHIVDVDSQIIAYRQAGAGPALVLLHGFLCDSRCWRHQLLHLSNQFSVIAWDAPGAGLSSDPLNTFTTANYARCLAGFLDAIGIERAHILGLSWGGILAQEFYRLYAERFRSLVLADTYAGWRGSLPETVWRERLATCLHDASGSPKALVAKFLPGVFSKAAPQHLFEELCAIVSEFHPVGFRLMSLSSAEVDTRDLLPSVDVPTLVLWGEEDRRSPLHVAEQFYAAIPGAQLAIIPKAGHLSNMEQPEVFNSHVRRFCLTVWITAAPQARLSR